MILPLTLLLSAPPDFDRQVAPILASHCLDCHSGADPKAELDLSRRASAIRQDGSITPGKPEDSPLWEKVAANEMPPKKPLSDAEKAILKEWIASGAKWGADPIDPYAFTTAKRGGRDWWSLQPIREPAIPTVDPSRGGRNVVDALIDRDLAARNWRRAPEADRRTLIRRVYFDLLGLPPTFEEVEAFANDPDDAAYEKLIDRLLANPHFGERWGRHWLDAARYAETCGYERDQVKPDVWKYRDWVVRAFNDDLPFAEFATQQLAGDEIPHANVESAIATGFIRLGTWNDEPNDPNDYKYERLEDMVGATSTAFLGLTVKCARCHDHKFDPILQTDYYRMAGAFWAGFIEPGARDDLGGPDAKTFRYAGVFGWTDRGRDAPPLRLLKKGETNRPGEIVPPGFLSAIPALDKAVEAAPAGSKTTTRRLQLAKWIVDPKNPLAARVWVNRIWQHHFGQGLVRTPDNFGFTGDRPTHPELLDWLAAEFLANGGYSKPLHRSMLLSATYRQASVHPQHDEYAKTDAGNRFWWHAERRRLDAESLRDALLAAGGNLKRARFGGPGFTPPLPPDALEGLSTKTAAWKPSPPAEQGRRSLYIFAKRSLLAPLLTTFDAPDTTLPNCKRDVTTAPTQALVLLNNPFVHEQSAALAGRVSATATGARIAQAWRLAFSRDPTPRELAAASRYLEQQTVAFNGRPAPERVALASLCHVLLNANEFLHVD